ncbi:hypothetical protein SPRG_08290 [Saprolegnia parasitica CBS 223.65]|uniref:Choloylglycine hydrolase/NAAA C-terminal domain-containing protein n=1 Tax=Saprolegnia parasitica (strain CBS 223.65) TaxID=695850 RepID=A0A067CI39_SAPPC|nr:hypothetical protein SPRG_08290 [Saprolegnia parasitica CBS 223.65]KDO26487.1 hypothetical protein SPRG_08290 [Saprolegnia parasitica CBS 223.65]|eukprot:XP_012202922.1 hypothetical protein SPRG_08290 [Saprolegnia parasitica CBS 223.65]
MSCSDVRLHSDKVGVVVSARTMDFNLDLQSTLEIVPRATLIQEPLAKDCTSCADYGWRNRYGFVGLNMLSLNVATDGLNEAGLSAAWLYLVGTTYPTPNMTDPRPVVTSVITYILGNYATVADVKTGLASIQIAEPHPGVSKLLGTDSGFQSLPLHIAVHDAAGESLVVEFLNGTVHMHDNPNGVMTNAPPLPTHLASLANMEKKNASLPGGYDSESRFLRLSLLNDVVAQPYLAATSYNASTPEQASISAALHLIDTVTIPVAALRQGGSTQFTVVRDHVQRKLYVKATQNQVLRLVDVGSLDLTNAGLRKSIPVTFGDWFVNVTDALLAATGHSKDMPPRSFVVAALRSAPAKTQLATHAAADQSHALTFALGTIVGMTMMAIVNAVVAKYRRYTYVSIQS